MTRMPFGIRWVASERVKARPEIAQHFANAFVRALKFINTHTPEEIADVIPVAPLHAAYSPGDFAVALGGFLVPFVLLLRR